MIFSTKIRYGARFMVDLALHCGEAPVPLKDIAQRQEISEKYLWNVIGPLKTAGLIRSERGSNGGFVIARPLSEINMKDIVCALNGTLCVVECVGSPETCDRTRICVTREVWQAVTESITQTLELLTLEDMVNKCTGYSWIRWEANDTYDHTAPGGSFIPNG